MELDLWSLFGLQCTAVGTHWLIPRNSRPPPLPPHLGSYTRALLVSQDRRHLFVTPLTNRAWGSIDPDRNIFIYAMKIRNGLRNNRPYGILIEEGRAASKSPHWKFGYFLSISQQEVSADITKNSAVANLNHEYWNKHNYRTVLEKDLDNVSERKQSI